MDSKAKSSSKSSSASDTSPRPQPHDHPSLVPLHIPVPQQPSAQTNGEQDKIQSGFLSARSTHGHDLLEIDSMAKHSGASVSKFFTGLFQTILAISTLGASITFNYVLNNQSATPQPRSGVFSATTIQTFLAVSWLLFLLALAFAALGSTLLTFFRRHWEEDWDGKRGVTSQTTVQLYAVFASSLMGVLVVAAFSLLCLVVVGYSSVVGWIALGFTSFFGFIMLLSIVTQVPWPWRDENPHLRSRHAWNRRGADKKVPV